MEYLDIELLGSDNKSHKLRDFLGKKVVLYFYPKDSTSGCTLEANEFTKLKGSYLKKGYIIIGVSKDSIKSHLNFIEKENLDLLLLSDPNEELISIFDVMKEKSMYGKKYLGIERSTFILDQTGKIIRELRKVNAKNHPLELLEEL
jgi:peroxiredoxin Q/BCP